MKSNSFLLLTILASNLSVAAADTQELQIALQEAKEFTRNGQFAEALDKHVWYHENSRGTSHAGVRLSFAMTDWKKLGEVFPAAKEKLSSLRDQAAKAALSDTPNPLAVNEVIAIDRTMEEAKRSLEFINNLAEKHPAAAKASYWYVRDLLMEHREYALCRHLSPEPEAEFKSIRETWHASESFPDNVKPSVRQLQVRRLRQFIELLVATGDEDLAQKFQERAVELTKDKSLESALEDAKKRVKAKP